MCEVHGVLHEGQEYNLDDCKEPGLGKIFNCEINTRYFGSDDVQLPPRFGKQKATRH